MIADDLITHIYLFCSRAAPPNSPRLSSARISSPVVLHTGKTTAAGCTRRLPATEIASQRSCAASQYAARSSGRLVRPPRSRTRSGAGPVRFAGPLEKCCKSFAKTALRAREPGRVRPVSTLQACSYTREKPTTNHRSGCAKNIRMLKPMSSAVRGR